MGTLQFREGRQESACASCVVPAKAKRIEIQSDRVGQKERTIVRCKDCGRVLSETEHDAGPEDSKPDIGGTWTGVYAYHNTGAPGTGRPPVEFKTVLKAAGSSFVGETSEYALLMDNTSAVLTADISGVLAPDGAVHFVKKYKGGRAFNPPIDYRGKLSRDGRVIEGTWSLPSGNTGDFRMTR